MLVNYYNKIPLDNINSNFIIININEKQYSIDILYDWKEKFELYNIFLILKSYTLSKEILIKGLYIISSNELIQKNNIKPNFFRSLDVNKISKMNYIDFTILYEEMFENDWKNYLTNFDFYGFRIITLVESNIWINKNFYPKYPWNENFKKNYIFYDDKKKEIYKLKREIIILKKKLKYSLYRDVRWNNKKNRWRY